MKKKKVSEEKLGFSIKRIKFNITTLITVSLILLGIFVIISGVIFHNASLDDELLKGATDKSSALSGNSISTNQASTIEPYRNYSFILFFGFSIFIFSVLIGTFLVKSISGPIYSLNQEIRKISDGDLKIQLQSSNITDIENLRHSLNSILASLKLAVYKTGISEEELFGKLVDEKKTILKELKAKQHFINKMIDTVGVSIIAYNENGKLMFVNEDFLKSTGYTVEEVEEFDTFISLSFPGELPAKKIKNALAKAQKGKSIKDFVVPVMCKDGLTSIYINNITKMEDSSNKNIGYVISMRDIGEVFQLEQQIRFWSANGFSQVRAHPEPMQHSARKLHVEISNPNDESTKEIIEELKNEGDGNAKKIEIKNK